MKVTPTTTPQFTPVNITLETQEEVDTLYAFFNCSPLVEGTCFGGDTRVPLRQFTTELTQRQHAAVFQRIKEWGL